MSTSESTINIKKVITLNEVRDKGITDAVIKAIEYLISTGGKGSEQVLLNICISIANVPNESINVKPLSKIKNGSDVVTISPNLSIFEENCASSVIDGEQPETHYELSGERDEALNNIESNNAIETIIGIHESTNGQQNPYHSVIIESLENALLKRIQQRKIALVSIPKKLEALKSKKKSKANNSPGSSKQQSQNKRKRVDSRSSNDYNTSQHGQWHENAQDMQHVTKNSKTKGKKSKHK